MAYTKTNLNETTETVAVDMTAEDIENNETTETVVEQNARGYSKTVWNESTPITADKLNKMETGIANGIDKTEQVMEIPITNSEGWQQFRWTRPNCNTISWTRDAEAGKALEIYNETTRHQLLLFKDDGKLTVNGKLEVGQDIVSPVIGASADLIVNRYGFITYFTNNVEGSVIHCDKNNSSISLKDNRMVYANPHGNLEIGPQNPSHCHIYTDRGSFYFNKELYVNGHTVWHTGNFNPATKLDAGEFSISHRDLKVYGKRALVGFNTPDGNYLSINHDRDFANGVAIHGLLKADNIEAGGNLVFSGYGSGRLNSTIANTTLHNHTGNGQIINVGTNNTIFVGNPNTPLALESNGNPMVNIGANSHALLHSGSLTQKMRFGGYSADRWENSQIEINAGLSGGIARLNFHREGHSQMSIVHKTKDQLHVEYDNGAQKRILTDGDPCARFSWDGSRISIDGGRNNAAVSLADTSEVARHIHNSHTGRNLKFRADAGLGPLEGEITFTW